jgi:NDP-sugar pyrophosphorylase family protein
MGYQAIVMAGGEGSRLPLAKCRPKPNVYVGGDRAMHHIFRSLERGGVDRVVVPVQYKASHITRRMHEEYRGKLEPEAVSPLVASGDVMGSKYNGTADCVRKTRRFLEGRPKTVVVTSADVLTNIEIGDLIEAHVHYANKGAWATIATVEMPKDKLYRFGVIIKDRHGRVQSFVEKPRSYPKETGEINASFYVVDRKLLDLLDKLKKEGMQADDFGKDIFPNLAKDGKLFSYLAKGAYWRDIGIAEDYIQGNLDMIDGIPGIESPLRKDDEMHCLVGKGFKTQNSSTRDSVIGNYVEIRGSSVRNSVLVGGNEVINTDLRNVVVDNLATIHGSKVGEFVIVGRDVFIEPGSVIADGVSIDPGAKINPEMGAIARDVIREYRQKS